MERHLPYGIIKCYLFPPDAGERSPTLLWPDRLVVYTHHHHHRDAKGSAAASCRWDLSPKRFVLRQLQSVRHRYFRAPSR